MNTVLVCEECLNGDYCWDYFMGEEYAEVEYDDGMELKPYYLDELVSKYTMYQRGMLTDSEMRSALGILGTFDG